ncbi:AAA family ATPase [Methylobacterium sp. J-076]|uniref:AAA family ATPase n=1 Tax=Methylobacterium sp. J-076 TaxID=2836655 RepID=UPI001FB9B928|nr:AAA family ATPase [Methylobacterium sp. J-076]MCJ2014197.1 AAA family ATPase [Methylobacterium sp. J-076]
MIKNLRKPIVTDIEAAEFLEGDEPDPAAPPASVAAATVLARLLLGTALTARIRRRIVGERGLALLVDAPTAAWVVPLRRALNSIAAWDLSEVRDGTTRHRRKPDEGAEELAECMARGKRVAVVCHAPEAHVPPAFVAAADLRLRPGRPTPALVAAAIRVVTGNRPRTVPAGVEGLDLPDLTSALRGGTGGATACVRRLERAIAARATSSTRLRDVPHVRDLQGHGREAIEWALKLVEDRETLDAENFWKSADKSCCLFGEPGVGKTSLVHSLAKSLKLPLVETSIANWFETSTYLDKTIVSMMAAFSSARSMPNGCVLLLDEIDGLPSRDNPQDRNSSYWAPVQAAYLRELEMTAAPGSRVILVGATNFPRRVDPATLRPGRLGRLVHVRRPDAAGLAGILRQHLGNDLPGVDLAGVAVAGAGATGADAMSWVAAARRTARVAARPMEVADIMAAMAPPDERSPADRHLCAIHEISHAVVGHRVGAGRIKRISLIQTASSGGSITAGFEGAMVHTAGRLRAMVVMALAGRAGEEAFGYGPSTGSHDDLQQATAIAAAIRVSFGLGETLLHRRHMDRADEILEHDADLREQVEADLQACYSAALSCVRLNKSLIKSLAKRLLVDLVIEGPTFLRLVREHEAAMDGHAALTMEARHG